MAADDYQSLSVAELHELRAELYELRDRVTEELGAVDAEITARQGAAAGPAEGAESGDAEAGGGAERWPVAPTPGRVHGRGPLREVHRSACWSHPRESPTVTTAEARRLLSTGECGACPSCRPSP